MSVLTKSKPVTCQSLQRKKQQGQKITSLTCYDYTTAKLLDETDLDFLLVGDSLAMTVLGHPNTLGVTVDEMLHHVKAVSRGTQRALVVADMPFMSYHVDLSTAIQNAGRFIQEGHAGAVKVEGATPLTLSLIQRLVSMGIPVMGHLGFTPQSVHTLGGFRVQGKTLDAAKKMAEEASQLQEAGAFSLVLEMVPVEVASLISQQLQIPTIGIGSGNGCDGQVLVIDDLLARYQDLTPRFVRQYLQAGRLIQEAVRSYQQDVESKAFPNNTSEAFGFDPDLLPELHLALLN